MRSPYEIIKKPLVSEKNQVLKELSNQVVFEVASDANKIEIRRAVEDLFKVRVEKVRTLIVRGKDRRVGRRMGRQSNWKKAVVTLRQGENIELFEGV
jgi:large subunit ribosomal protein L23